MTRIPPGGKPQALRPFTVTIGARNTPRLSFEVMAPNAQRAGEQADDLAQIGERVEVLPLPARDLQLAAQWIGNPADLPLEPAVWREAGVI